VDAEAGAGGEVASELTELTELNESNSIYIDGRGSRWLVSEVEPLSRYIPF